MIVCLKLRLSYTIGVCCLVLTAAGAGAAENSKSPNVHSLFTPQPLFTQGQLLANSIYDTTDWLRKVPYEWGFPIVARWKIKDFLKDIHLEKPARRRIHQRIDAKDFIDELVPFLQALKSLYLPAAQQKPAGFDTYLKSHFPSGRAVPGLVHSMYPVEKPKTGKKTDSPAKGAGIDPKMVSLVLSLYDAVYLQQGASGIGSTMACGRQRSTRELGMLSDRGEPWIKKMMEYGLTLIPEQSDIRHAVKKTIEDNNRLQAITVSVIELLDQQVCKHYGMFSVRVHRKHQYERWMLKQLKLEMSGRGDGRLWNYLRYANEGKRYVLHVVVDGLQGHLLEALSGGNGKSEFIQSVVQRRPVAIKGAIPMDEILKGQAINRRFLNHFAGHGFKQRGYLDYFKRLYQRRVDGAHVLLPTGIVRQGISTTPTISVRNLPIAKTGAPVAGPGSTGLPNFHFVDRHGQSGNGRYYYFYGNDALRLDEITRRGGMRTLFERVNPMLSFNCGAQFDRGAHFTVDGLLALAVGEAVRDFAEKICLRELRQRVSKEIQARQQRQTLLNMQTVIVRRHRFWEWYDRWGKRNTGLLARRLIAQIADLEAEGLPQYVLYYNPWPDHFAHFKGPFSDEIISPSGELNRLDYWMQQFADLYRQTGVLSRTMFGMAGDHGLTPVNQVIFPEKAVFQQMRRRGIPVKVKKISSDEGEGPKINNRLSPPVAKGLDVIIASTAGGNYMLDFFIDQKQKFTQQPLYRDLRALKLLNYDKPVNMVREIFHSLRQSLDYMVVREKPCGLADCRIRLLGDRGGKALTAFIERRGERILYQSRGGDLLSVQQLNPYTRFSEAQIKQYRRLLAKCLAASLSDVATWCTSAQWRALTAYTEKPDSVVQLAHIYDSDLAGTVNLFPKAGVGYNTRVPGRHAGEHFHEKDAFVGVWGFMIKRPMSKGRIDTAVNGSVPVTLYQYLTGNHVQETGLAYPSLLKDLAP